MGSGERKEGIIIAKLRKGQALRVTCTARKGIGKDHAKWSPVATAVFRYQPQVTLRQEVIRRMTPAQRADWAASDPNQILKYDAATQAVTLGDIEAYAYDRECLIRCAELGFPTAIEIVQKQDTFIFTVEATGALPPTDIVLNGA
jgi:DNA-directed RNA polymerase II subunit RPB3